MATDGGFGEYLEWLQKQQTKIDLLEEREREQAETFSDLRRGEFQDRTGFAGLINVGDAVRRSDATLAAEVSALDTDDPASLAYQDALAAERSNRSKQTRVITGEQYRAEDAFAALEERLAELDLLGANDLEGLLSDYEEFAEEFDFFDEDFLADATAALAKAKEEEAAEEERRRRRQERERQRQEDEAAGGETGFGDTDGGFADPGDSAGSY